ncbi:hypothetical protein M404DRAFT_995483 [Pisolithus tinctorius Marx 270]|uniref:Uncharacterized protein n=1 Tax=Pisolithus tinctorius Marx 270 TaxID=870435 RepID=A0A0C3PPA4_PISTI|nr:hypothetical protein M404DRAFT_995483 [Pisolithus tinctorius Marx 270]
MTREHRQHQFIYPQSPNSATQQEGSACSNESAIGGVIMSRVSMSNVVSVSDSVSGVLVVSVRLQSV